MQNQKQQAGFSILEVLLGLVIIAVLIGTGWFVFANREKDASEKQGNTAPNGQNKRLSDEQLVSVRWHGTGTGWLVAEGTPPSCEDPLTFPAPANVFQASAVLYPGQMRGDTYRSYGGFRFDTLGGNEVNVRVPMDGVVVRGNQYLAQGEAQYTFDIIHPCGIMHRLGHLRELSPAFAQIASKFPTATDDASRMTQVDPVVVRQGDLAATKVGTIKNTDSYFDWGVYDLRQANPISSNSGWAAEHQNNKELDWHGICWLDMLPENEQNKAKDLPAGDQTIGKRSDYCN